VVLVIILDLRSEILNATNSVSPVRRTRRDAFGGLGEDRASGIEAATAQPQSICRSGQAGGAVVDGLLATLRAGIADPIAVEDITENSLLLRFRADVADQRQDAELVLRPSAGSAAQRISKTSDNVR
jgi:hypothetical protein